MINFVHKLYRVGRKLYGPRRQKNEAVRWKPALIYPDDLFLVSYPKSGNTWLRFLIANLLKQPGEEIDFYTSINYIPEVVTHDETIESLERPRVMKSHAPYLREYPRVIYMIRDGRDVYVSYYFHRLKKLPQNTTFKEFLERDDHFPGLWGDHVASWLFKEHGRSQKILVVRYEELLCDCLAQLRRMVDFMGMETTEDQLQDAVEAASFKNMRRLEIEKGRPYKDTGPDIFVREGRWGTWKELFGPEERAIFKAREGHVLVKLGYEQDNTW
jgi:hypothetical protein